MTRKLLRATALLAVAAVALGASAAGAAELPTPGPVINIVEWDGNSLPPVYERSAQPPLTQDDLVRLHKGGFDADMLAATLRERRYVGDVSADGLLALKSVGVPAPVIRSASLHALPPNRAVNLTLILEFDGTSAPPRRRFLYIIVPDGDVDRVFTADLAQVLGGKWSHDVQLDHSDPLIPRPVRRVTFSARVPLREPGTKTLHVFTSARPGIRTLADRPSMEPDDLQTHEMDYPASSQFQDCRMFLRFRQDRVLPDKWAITGATLECEWN